MEFMVSLFRLKLGIIFLTTVSTAAFECHVKVHFCASHGRMNHFH